MFKPQPPKSSASKPGDRLSSRMRAIQETAPPAELPPVPDKRPQRQASFKTATVKLKSGEKINVVMKNVSPTGARLEFFARHRLSDVIHISEQSIPLSGKARVIWQEDGAAGVEFLS